MGSKDDSTPGKTSKQTTQAQEVSTTPSYSEWPTPIPAYYGPGAAPSPAFYPPTVPSPTPHPYMWAGQHLMPPYGTPLPYPPIYPHGGLYAHPSMAAVPGTALPGKENEGKSNGKERGSAKKSEGHSGLASGKSGEGGKAISGSTSDGASQSGDSGSEGSSVASDENGNQQDTTNKKKSFDQMLADGANAQYSGGAGDSSFATRPAKLPVSAPGKVAAPATNLNIGMDLWSAPPAAGVPMKGRPATISPGVPPDQMWISDERELKRQRRKQSNRESARRSRLRKQAEYEDLAAKADALRDENQTLRAELQRLAEKCEKLESENNSIMVGQYIHNTSFDYHVRLSLWPLYCEILSFPNSFLSFSCNFGILNHCRSDSVCLLICACWFAFSYFCHLFGLGRACGTHDVLL